MPDLWKGLDPIRSHTAMVVLSLMLGEQNMTGNPDRLAERKQCTRGKQLAVPPSVPKNRPGQRQERKKLATFLPAQERIKPTMAKHEKRCYQSLQIPVPWWHITELQFKKPTTLPEIMLRAKYCRFQRCCWLLSHFKRTSHNITGAHIRTAALPILSLIPGPSPKSQ